MSLTAWQRIGHGVAAALAAATGGLIIWGCFRTACYEHDLNLATAVSTASPTYAEARLRQAVVWRPDLADAWRELATRESASDLSLALTDAQRAIRLDGGEWRNWEALGLLQLQQGDIAGAKGSFERAVDLNRGFQSIFELGNLELITGEDASARRDLMSALRMATPEGVATAVRELLSLGVAPAAMAEPLRSGGPGVQSRAVLALVAAKRLQGAAAVYRAMDCNSLSAQACGWATDALVSGLWTAATAGTPGPKGAEYARTAQQIWDQAVAQDTLPGQSRVQPGHVLNGNFDEPWTNQPLEWVASDCVNTGEGLADTDNRRGLFFQFNGQEADSCPLVGQWVLVDPGQRFTLNVDSLLDRPPGHGRGVYVEVKTAADDLLASKPLRLENRWLHNQMRFQVPPDTYLVRVAFAYRRAMGTVPLRASVGLADIRLTRSNAK